MNLTNKEKYRNFCKKEYKLPIFLKDFWLDSVCWNNREVAIFEKGWKIWWVMPYYQVKKWPLSILTMPKLTQFLWPYIIYPENQKYYKKISWEKKVMEDLISQLPKFHYFIVNFSSKITNILPFYWKWFETQIRYTYKIPSNSKLEELEKNFETDIRRRRKKAEKLGIKVIESKDIKAFYKLNEKTFKRQWRNIPYSFDFVKKLFNTLVDSKSVKLYFAQNPEWKKIAWGVFVYDSNDVYYLMGWIDENYKDLWWMDMVIYEWIKFALNNKKNFDFEWSMVESIEKYFRSFWSIQVPYYQVSKNNISLFNPTTKLKIMKFFKDLLKI